MGISTFPAPSAGGETNDFILDKNGTTNTTFSPGRSFAAGGYSVVVTGSTAYDIYLLDSSGSSVGYTNGTSIVASDAFEEISALGLGTADTVSFTYNGPSTNATTTGDETGAGPFLVSITPSDLPNIDDTAVVAGGNFASNVEVSFVSGTVTKAAKNVVVGSSTALVVTRPDDLTVDLEPYDLKAINPGVTEPTGSNANILAGTVTAGSGPTFVTTSPILGAFPGSAFSTAILVADSDGTVVSWEITAGSVPSGLSFSTADGAISGTPSTAGDYSFTVQITDDGGNTNSQAFDLPVGLSITAPNSTVVSGTAYYWWTASDDIVIANSASESLEYLVIAGGGGGGTYSAFQGVGGGGAGGLLLGTATASDGTATITVGAGGAQSTNGNNSVWSAIATAIAGGKGGQNNVAGSSGGSGGGGGKSANGGSGTAGQGNSGGAGSGDYGGGGGGAGAGGSNGSGGGAGSGGNGLNYGAWATAVNIIVDGGYFSGGGRGGEVGGSNGLGRGTANSGGGGERHTSGDSGVVIVRVI